MHKNCSPATVTLLSVVKKVVYYVQYMNIDVTQRFEGLLFSLIINIIYTEALSVRHGKFIEETTSIKKYINVGCE